MTYVLKIQIAIAILCIAEAWLEVVVIALKNPSLINYAKLNKQEHRRSAGFWVAQVVLFISLSNSWEQALLLTPALILNRRVWFEYALKILRPGKRLKDIEGDQFFDKLSRRLFGARGGYFELSTCILVIIAINKYLL